MIRTVEDHMIQTVTEAQRAVARPTAPAVLVGADRHGADWDAASLPGAARQEREAGGYVPMRPAMLSIRNRRLPGTRDLTPVAVALALAAVLWAASSALITLRAALDRPVYTVTQVQDILLRNPQQLAGQTIQVRGVLQRPVAIPCALTISGCIPSETQLTDPGAPSTGGLVVEIEMVPPVASWVPRLPLLGTLLTPGQTPHWGVVAIYRLRMGRLRDGEVTFTLALSG